MNKDITKDIKNKKHFKLKTTWQNIFEHIPSAEEKLLFLYRGVFYIGWLMPCFSGRPIKFIWMAEDGEMFNMEDLEYGEDDCQAIEFWCPLPKVNSLEKNSQL